MSLMVSSSSTPTAVFTFHMGQLMLVSSSSTLITAVNFETDHLVAVLTSLCVTFIAVFTFQMTQFVC